MGQIDLGIAAGHLHAQPGGDLTDLRRRQLHKIGQRLQDDAIQTEHDRQNDQRGAAARHGRDALLIVEVLQFLLHPPLIPGIGFLDLLHLGLDPLDLHHGALLLEAQRQHQDLHQQREQEDGPAIAAHDLIDQPHHIAEGGGEDRIEKIHVPFSFLFL